ncbi:MAG: hypothetical protein RLZZ435_2975 [Cyanobacteriota bacterium]
MTFSHLLSFPDGLSSGLYPTRLAQSAVFSEGALDPVQRLLDSSLTLGQALIFLVGGWILGMILASWTKKGLEKTKIDNQIASWILADDSQSFPIENWMARLVFWLVFTFALVGFLETLQLTAVSQPLNSFLNEIPAMHRACSVRGS